MTKTYTSCRLAIVSSHPIQYNAPLFRALSWNSGLDIKVFYSWIGTCDQNDPEFGHNITWDVPLLDGYNNCFVNNISTRPGTHHFSGLDNPEMVDLIADWKPNAILVYGWAFKTHLRVMRHFIGLVPVFFRGDSTPDTGGNPLRQFFRKLVLRWVYKHVDYVFYPGQKSKQYFLQNGLKEQQLIHIPHSVDNDFFNNNSAELEKKALQQRELLNIPQEALTILFAGKLVQRKQPLLLLNTVKEIVEQINHNIHLIYVGTGPLLDKLKKAAIGCDYVHFLGFKNQSEMPVIYRLADVFILPSTIETWGLAVNEAMACGRAVITSDRVGCSVDLIREGETGNVFKSNDSLALKSILLSYLDNKEKTEQMGKNAQQLIDKWSVNRAARQMAESIIEHS